MVQIFAREEFKEIEIEDGLQFRYAISNLGRLISFTNRFEDGRVLRGSLQDGYRIFRYRVRIEGEVCRRYFFYYKLVARYFLKKTSEGQVFVLHLNRDRADDYAGNLKWATKKEMVAHMVASPFFIEAKQKLKDPNRASGVKKLTATKVMRLKKILLDPNRKTRYKILAREFGVTEMQLHRIKTGENWGTIKV
jgi:NUMOD4 motif